MTTPLWQIGQDIPETQAGGKYGLLWGVRDPNSFLLNGPIAGTPDQGQPNLTEEQKAYVQRLKDLGLDPKWTYKDTSNENGASGGYELEYDKSKLPKSVLGDNFKVVDHNSDIKDNNLVRYDPNYGYITVPGNTNEGIDWVSTIGPMAVGAFAAGAPALFGALSGGALGAGAGLTGGLSASQGMNLANSGMGLVRGAASGNLNPLGLASSALNFVPGGTGSLFSGFSPEIQNLMNLARQGYGYYNQYNNLSNLYNKYKGS